MKEIVIAIVQALAAISSLVLAWALGEYAPAGWAKMGLIFFLAIVLLFPARYRWVGDKQKKWIRIPYLFVGFCELAIVVFDRFKTAEPKQPTGKGDPQQ
jgi:hypothetical protein